MNLVPRGVPGTSELHGSLYLTGDTAGKNNQAAETMETGAAEDKLCVVTAIRESTAPAWRRGAEFNWWTRQEVWEGSQ